MCTVDITLFAKNTPFASKTHARDGKATEFLQRQSVIKHFFALFDSAWCSNPWHDATSGNGERKLHGEMGSASQTAAKIIMGRTQLALTVSYIPPWA